MASMPFWHLIDGKTNKRKNHDLNVVLQLLAVLHYADLLENDADMAEDEGEPAPLNPKPQSGLVKSCTAW